MIVKSAHAASPLLLIVATLGFAPAAQADTGGCSVAANAYAGGSGTAVSPYEIATPEQFQRLRELPLVGARTSP